MKMRSVPTTAQQQSEKGNVLFMILIAIVLMGALSAVMMRGGGEQAVSMNADRLSQELKSQAQAIRSAILECNLVYNFGYPPAAYSGPAGDIQCQIDETPTYQPIFTGTANRFMPPPPRNFNAWEYNNDGSGTIYFEISSTTPSDAGTISALEMLKNQYASTEADIVNDGSSASLRVYLTRP